MHDLTYSEMKTLENMLDVYLIHCTKMSDRWRKSVTYPEIYVAWVEKQEKAKRIISFLLEGEHDEETGKPWRSINDVDDEEPHGDDPR